MAQVDRGDVHLGLVGWRGESQDQDCRLIGHDNMVLVVPDGHPLGNRKTATVDQFAAEPLILREAGSGQRHSFAESLSRAGKSLSELRVVLELGSNEPIKEAILRGMGLAVLSTFVVEKEFRAGHLRTLKIKDIPCQRDLFVVQNRRRVLPLAARLFLNHLATNCLRTDSRQAAS